MGAHPVALGVGSRGILGNLERDLQCRRTCGSLRYLSSHPHSECTPFAVQSLRNRDQELNAMYVFRCSRIQGGGWLFHLQGSARADRALTGSPRILRFTRSGDAFRRHEIETKREVRLAPFVISEKWDVSDSKRTANSAALSAHRRWRESFSKKQKPRKR